MKTKLDHRIAEDTRLHRAVRTALAPPEPKRIPDPALIRDRMHAHGKDSGCPARIEMAEAMTDAAKQIGVLHRNPTKNAAEVLIAAADMLRQRVARLEDRVEGERQIVANRRAEVATGIAAALRAPRAEWVAAAPEIRTVLRGMSADEQEVFLDSLKGDDALMVQYAVAGVHPALSRVSFGIHKAMRDALIERHDPELLKKPADLDARAAALDIVEDGIRRTAAELVDFEQADALNALASGDDVP